MMLEPTKILSMTPPSLPRTRWKATTAFSFAMFLIIIIQIQSTTVLAMTVMNKNSDTSSSTTTIEDEEYTYSPPPIPTISDNMMDMDAAPPDTDTTVHYFQEDPSSAIYPTPEVEDLSQEKGKGPEGEILSSLSSRSTRSSSSSPFFNFLPPTDSRCMAVKEEQLRMIKMENYSMLYNYLTFSGAHKLNETVTIGFLYSAKTNQFSRGALALAVEQVNNNQTILKGRKLRYITENLGDSPASDPSLPIRIMTKMRDEGAIAFIGGPEETCQSEALVASAWNLPMISYQCTDHRVSNKSIYTTFARTVPPSSKVSKAVVGLLKHFNWTQVALVLCPSNTVRDSEVQSEAFKILAKRQNINITHIKEMAGYIPETFPEMMDLVEETYKHTRVYVFMGEHVAMVQLLRAMTQKNLFDKGEYIVISVDDRNDLVDFFELDLYPSFKVPKSSMMSAYRSVLKIHTSHPQTEKFVDTQRSVKKYSAAPPFCVPSFSPQLFETAEVSDSAVHLYDAVAVYADALSKVLNSGIDPRNGTAILEEMRNRRYESIQGYWARIDENGDAEGNYTVLSLLPIEPPPANGNASSMSFSSSGSLPFWDPNFLDYVYNSTDHKTNTTIPMTMQPVGYFQQIGDGDDIAVFKYFNPSRPIQWVADRPPESEPKCGFYNQRCIRKTDWKMVVISFIFSSVFGVAIILAARHYRYEQKLACLLWKIDMKDVIIIPMGPLEPANGTKSTVALCRQLLGTAVDADAPLELACKKAYTRIGFYKGMVVAIKPICKKSIDLTRNIRKELKQIRELRQENIIPFIGASVDHGNICILTAYSARGSLEDVLQNEDIHLDKMFLASLVFDLIKGMIYLHDSEIISHGNLKSSNCLVDSRWVLQIADFGLHEFKAGQETRRDLASRIKQERKLLWRAPELLRDPSPPPRGTQKGDVYSFGVVLYEMIGRNGPWGKTGFTVSEIIDRVTHPRNNTILRPPTDHLDCSETVLKCMLSCWEEDPELRPDFRYIRVRLKEMQTGLKPNIFDNMLSIMEKYACNLEDLVQERTTQLMEEKKKTDALLHRMLPKSVAESLKRGEPVEAESFDSVTIYFSDIVGFTALSAISTPMQVVELLNDLYTCFDSIISNYDVYKVETIGDAYMVSGLPIRNGNQHAGEVASMSLHLLDRIRSFEIRHRPGERLKLRIGIHSGPVVAGVVGLKMPRYCLFGDTVNTASRMESSGEALKIHISEATQKVLETLGGYYYKERGIIPIKGKGDMRTYWLTGEDLSREQLGGRINSFTGNKMSEEGFQGPLVLSRNNLNKSIRSPQYGGDFLGGGRGRNNNNEDMAEDFHDISHQNNNLNLGNSTDDNSPGIGIPMQNGDLASLYKPTTWLLAECNNGKMENGSLKKSIGIGGRYVSCSNVFQECKANIIKELRKTGTVSSSSSSTTNNSRFRSAPIITFIDTSNPYAGPGFPYEEPKFV